jgi:type I restriction enzyme S subunit
MTNYKNVPALRFKEFEEELKSIKIGKITTWKSGGTPSKQREDFWNGDIPWISASSMRGTEYGNSKLKITKEGLKKGSRLTKKGTLLILVRGSMLFKKIPIGITTKDVAFNQDVKSIEINENHNSKFILYWFFSKENKILHLVTGTGIGAGKLDLSDLKSLKIPIPTFPE